jgi:hypothetical protein
MAIKEETLESFFGYQDRYRYSYHRKFFCTEGVKYIAEEGEAYWLLEAIFLQQINFLPQESFQVWSLKVAEDKTAVLEANDGNGNQLMLREIKYTDFPLAEIKLFLRDNILMLPNEY